MKTFKLDGEIATFDYDGDFGKFIGPKSVAAWLKQLKEGEEATVEINSCGGSVVAGLAIANAIKNAKAHVTAHVVGLAASMASVIACACDKVVMEEGSLMMIHDPWCAGMDGNAEDLRKEADVLDSMKAACMGFYRAKFEKTEEEIAAMMTGETWWNGRDAIANGFKCEVVASDVKLCACVCSFKNVPDEAKAFVRAPLSDEDMAKVKAEVDARERAEAEEAKVAERIASAMKSRDAEINALKAQLEEAHAKADAYVAERLSEFENQLRAKDEELAEARAQATSHAERAEKAEREFAGIRDQLATLEAAHARLMGGVLTPNATETAADAKKREMSAARTPEERERVRAKYRGVK